MTQEVLDYLARLLDMFLVLLNPMSWAETMFFALTGWLPGADSSFSAVAASALLALPAFLQYISMFDYFMDLAFFVKCCLFALTIESALSFPRAWRFVRSMVT
jgi:hypothetical protein